MITHKICRNAKVKHLKGEKGERKHAKNKGMCSHSLGRLSDLGTDF